MQGLKYPHRQEIKIMKNDDSIRYITTKDNITTTYIEQKHKNTGTSVLIHPGQEMLKNSISLNPSFGLSLEI